MGKVEKKNTDREDASMNDYAAGHSLTNAFTANIDEFKEKNG